jgi:hypothetical protein
VSFWYDAFQLDDVLSRKRRWLISRKLLAFLLSELNTVRIICKRAECGAITEIPISSMAKMFSGNWCPACQHQFVEEFPGKPVPPRRLVELANAIAAVKDVQAIDLEFVLPDNGD